MKYVRIDLQGTYQEIGPQVAGLGSISVDETFRFDHFMETVAKIIRMKQVKRVLVVRGPDFSLLPFGALEAVRGQLKRLSDAGKEVFYYAADYGLVDCCLASVCTKRIVHPLGNITFMGIARGGLFFKQLLEKYRIKVDVTRRGRYKSAGDPFRTESYDDFNREQWQRLLDLTVGELRKTLDKDAGFGDETIDELLTGKLLTASQAVEGGIAHQAVSAEDLTHDWKQAKIKCKKNPKTKGRYGKGKKVAVLVFEGAIVDGKSRMDPLIGQAIGDRPMVKQIRKLREDKRTKAVLFRINSGGGSAVASENIVRELKLLAQKKPLVVSMGPIAGSGGYWISAAGERLFAQPTTVTGSIGVIHLHFQINEALSAYGISTDVVKHGKSADFGSSLRAMDSQEKKELEGFIETLYQEFISKVADVRKLKPETVHTLGEGRLWLGRDALEHGLVDEMGDIQDALDYLKGKLGYKHMKVVFLPKVKQPFISRLFQGKPSNAAWMKPDPVQVVQSCLALQRTPLLLEPWWYSGFTVY